LSSIGIARAPAGTAVGFVRYRVGAGDKSGSFGGLTAAHSPAGESQVPTSRFRA
jgi:hypothetical protein